MKDLNVQFAEKIAECHQCYKDQWKALDSDELIDRAEEIAAVQRLATAIPEALSTT